MKYNSIKKGKFLTRKNRFVALIEIENEVTTCHVKNTGRLKEILLPNTIVYVEEVNNPNRKTKYDLIAAKKGNRIINIDSLAPNKVVQENIYHLFPDLVKYQQEKTYKNSRFDFYIETKSDKIYIEVKGVTQEVDNVVMFPDAPTERGLKHIQELIDAVKKGYQAYIIFVIQLKDVLYFTPNNDIHEKFAELLTRAHNEGVHILAYDCNVTPNEITLKDSVDVLLLQN